MPFEAKTKISDLENILTLSGGLDEDSEIPVFKEKKNLRVNLRQISYTSSHGINTWCKWLSAHDQCPVIYLEECPYIFIRNASVLKGLLTPNVQILSFYVPYYNDSSEESKSVLFIRGRDFKDDGTLIFPQVFDSLGNEMDMDVVKEKYFHFLKS